jgi:hypothetical protein
MIARASAPSPRPNGERAGVRGYRLKFKGAMRRRGDESLTNSRSLKTIVTRHLVLLPAGNLTARIREIAHRFPTVR